MRIIKKLNIKVYVANNEMLMSFFNRAWNVFLSIERFLYFTSDNDAKRLAKLRSLFKNLENKLKTIYTPENNICNYKFVCFGVVRGAGKDVLYSAIISILIFPLWDKTVQTLWIKFWLCLELFSSLWQRHRHDG